MEKTNLVEVFEDTLDTICENPELAKAVQESIKTQKVYRSSDVFEKNAEPYHGLGHVIINKSKTLEATRCALLKDRKTAVLNFANAFNPGGGVKYGAKAQEEYICRLSTLYPCLASNIMKALFYDPHVSERGLGKDPEFGYDDAIYTKDVIVFKEEVEDNSSVLFKDLPDDHMFKIDVITCAAPNVSERVETTGVPVTVAGLYDSLKKRIDHILQVAIHNDVRNIVLGAWGCGAFKCDPSIVALAFIEVLNTYRHHFDNIVFAIYDGKDGNSNNYEKFKSIFEREGIFFTDGYPI